MAAPDGGRLKISEKQRCSKNTVLFFVGGAPDVLR
jgi:hypothetical protein